MNIELLIFSSAQNLVSVPVDAVYLILFVFFLYSKQGSFASNVPYSNS